MSQRFRAALPRDQALKLLELLQNGWDLQLVSAGPFAADLQLPDAPSPHVVNLEVSHADGVLHLEFHMPDDEGERRRRWLRDRASALGVELVLEPAD